MPAMIDPADHHLPRPIKSTARDRNSHRRAETPVHRPRRSPRRGLAAGWVIAQVDTEPMRCLQLGTGQWCPPESATWFPIRRAAENYAVELGHSIGREVEIVYLAEQN